jgi:acetyl-CoA carboxylase beta subunit
MKTQGTETMILQCGNTYRVYYDEDWVSYTAMSNGTLYCGRVASSARAEYLIDDRKARRAITTWKLEQ